MKVRHAVVIHFDSPAGMTYPPPRCPAVMERREGTVKQASWWTVRETLLREYVLPALERQQPNVPQVWGLFDLQDVSLAADVITLFCIQPECFISLNGPSGLWKHYQTDVDFDYLRLIHLDSDDLYAPTAIGAIAAVPPEEGQVIYFEEGYLFNFVDGELFEYNAGAVSPPFFAVTYPREALGGIEPWTTYRNKWQLNCFHYQMSGREHAVALPGRQFCVLLHGANTTSARSEHVQKMIGKRLITMERGKVIIEFGLVGWVHNQAAVVGEAQC